MNYRRPARQYMFHTLNAKNPGFPPYFKAAGRKPVKGGRGRIRKLHMAAVSSNGMQWRAWRDRGPGARRFKTWQEAWDYTQTQLRMVYNGSDA